MDARRSGGCLTVGAPRPSLLFIRDDANVVSPEAQGHVPETVRQALIRVCRSAFHWKGDVKNIFLDAGVPEHTYARYDFEENPKARIARLVLSDLRQLGASGVVIERKIIEELCRWERPHADAPTRMRGWPHSWT